MLRACGSWSHALQLAVRAEPEQMRACALPSVQQQAAGDPNQQRTVQLCGEIVASCNRRLQVSGGGPCLPLPSLSWLI